MRTCLFLVLLLVASAVSAQDYGMGAQVSAPIPVAGGAATAWGWVLSDSSSEYADVDCGTAPCGQIVRDDADFTVEFAFKSTSSGCTGWRNVLTGNHGTTFDTTVAFTFGNGAADSTGFSRATGTDQRFTPSGWDSDPCGDTSNWHFISYVYDFSEDDCFVYLDGVEAEADLTCDWSENDSFDSDLIEVCGNQFGDTMLGQCTEVRTWDIARTATEVANHDRCQLACEDGTDCPANLTHYWRFNEGTGSTVDDEAGSDDLTINGTMTWDSDTDEPFAGWTNDGSNDCADDS